MKVLITGYKGFVGTHLTRLLRDDYEMVPYYGDIRDFERLRNFLDDFRPDRIYHLAAQAYVPESFANPQRTFEVNTLGSLNLLEAVRQLGIKPKILLAGTSEEYGAGDVTEVSALRPRSPYAISKAAMDQLGELYHDAYGLHIVITRAFNHAGPGRGEMYAESAWAKQIVEIERGERELLEHGNLEAMRNYTDVRDIVRAYKLAIELAPGRYNICSNHNLRMQTVLNSLIRNSTADIQTRVNPALYRPADFSFKEPNCDLFKALTGWQPEISFHHTLADILTDWRQRL